MNRSIFLLLLLFSCSTNKHVDWAIQEYKAGDYEQSLDSLEEAVEPMYDGGPRRERTLNDRWRTRYLVFRGLAHFRLWEKTGDSAHRREAQDFLSKGRRAYEQAKDWSVLTVAEERELSNAIEAVREDGASE